MDGRGDAAAALRERLVRLREGGHAGKRAVDLAPASAYEAMTRQMVEGLADDLKEIKERLNGLLWMVAGAIVLDVALRLARVT